MDPAQASYFVVVVETAEVRALSSVGSVVVARLPKGTHVKIEYVDRDSGMVTSPTYGWISFARKDGTEILEPLKQEQKATHQPKSRKISLREVAEELSKGLTIRDRSYHLRTYPQCFVGSEAVTFMSQHGMAKSREQALKVLNKLHRLGVIRHVVNEHIVKDDYLFYRLDQTKLPKRRVSPTASFQCDQKTKTMQSQLRELQKVRDQEIEAENFHIASQLNDQIETLRDHMEEMQQRALSLSSSHSGDSDPGVRYIVGAKKKKRNASVRFNPTDFFSVSPGKDAKESTAPSPPPHLRSGSRIAVKKTRGIPSSYATVVRQKGPDLFYLLYDDGRCELQDMTKVSYLAVSPESDPHRPQSIDREKVDTPTPKIASRHSPSLNSESSPGQPARSPDIESLASSFDDFTIKERNLGKPTPNNPRQRSGRFSNRGELSPGSLSSHAKRRDEAEEGRKTASEPRSERIEFGNKNDGGEHLVNAFGDDFDLTGAFQGKDPALRQDTYTSRPKSLLSEALERRELEAGEALAAQQKFLSLDDEKQNEFTVRGGIYEKQDPTRRSSLSTQIESSKAQQSQSVD